MLYRKLMDAYIIKANSKQEIFSTRDLIIALVGLVFCLFFLVYPTILEKRNNVAAAIAVSTPSTPNPFDSISLLAKSAYVLDLNTGKVFFEKNSEAQLPLASLTKIMTAITALSEVPESTLITIETEDLRLEGDSGLFANEKWRLGDLLSLMLVESSNDGSFAVAGSVGQVLAGTSNKADGRLAFVQKMNEKAREFGLPQTYFNNMTGLDEGIDRAGGYGSAKDMAFLLGYAVKQFPAIFHNTKYDSLKIQSESELDHTAINTNKALDGIPVIIASKTGYTDLAGGNLAIVFDAGFNRPIAVVVLGSTEEGRFEDVKKMAWATLDALTAFGDH